MEPTQKTARIAGALYLIVVLTGMFTLAYVPSKLINWNDAAATVANIQSSETLFRLGIVAGILCYTAFLILPFVLYKLLNHVSKPYALGMVILSAVTVPFSLYNLVNKVNVLTFISGEPYLDALTLDQLQSQVMLALTYYENGIRIISIFWGLWLFPFGYLVFKSRILPKFLGVLLMAGCFGYLVNFTGHFLFPGYASLGIGRYISLPASLGEIGICLWLILVGIKKSKATHGLNTPG